MNFENVATYRSDAEVPSAVTLTWTQALQYDGEWDTATTMEQESIASLAGGSEVFVLYRLDASEPNGSGGYLLHVVGTDSDDNLVFPSICRDTFAENASDLAKFGGFESESSLVDRWLQADANGEGDEFADLEEALFEASLPEVTPWSDLDPAERSLLPLEVPGDIFAVLDVRPTYLELDGLTPPHTQSRRAVNRGRRQTIRTDGRRGSRVER